MCVVVDTLSLTKSLAGLVLVVTTFQLSRAAFVIRNAFVAMPTELDGAVTIDEAGMSSSPRRLPPLPRAQLITAGLSVLIPP